MFKVPKDSDVYFSCDFLEIKKGDSLKVGSYKIDGYYDSPFIYQVAMKGRKLKIRFKSNKKETGGGFRFVLDSGSVSEADLRSPV